MTNPGLSKDLFRYGQNTQIVHYKAAGGLKKPYNFTETQYFFEKNMWKYFPMRIKAKGMTQFDIFNVLVEIQ